jgi:hypothetical protein
VPAIAAKRGLVSMRSRFIVTGSIGSKASAKSLSARLSMRETRPVSIVVKARPSITIAEPLPPRPPSSASTTE